MVQVPKRWWLAMFFVTVLALAGAGAWLMWGFCGVMESAIADSFDRPVAPVTMFFIHYRLGVLLFPLPWLLVAACALVRGRMASHQLVLFASSLILSLGTLLITVAIVFSKPWIPYKLRHMNFSYVLPERQLIELIPKAEKGDGEAAMRLYFHYGFGRGEMEAANGFLDMAVKAGNPKALQFNEVLEEHKGAQPGGGR
jgi:hypothetical protein